MRDVFIALGGLSMCILIVLFLMVIYTAAYDKAGVFGLAIAGLFTFAGIGIIVAKDKGERK